MVGHWMEVSRVVCDRLGMVLELARPLRRAPELSGPPDKIEAFACPHLRKSVICLICCVGLACPTPVVRLAPPVPPLWGTGVPWNPSKSFMGTRECVWTLSHDKIKARTVQEGAHLHSLPTPGGPGPSPRRRGCPSARTSRVSSASPRASSPPTRGQIHLCPGPGGVKVRISPEDTQHDTKRPKLRITPTFFSCGKRGNE